VSTHPLAAVSLKGRFFEKLVAVHQAASLDERRGGDSFDSIQASKFVGV
jgi:hypothetical protein